MLGQRKKQTVPGWSIILVAVLLLLVAVSVEVLRAAKPDFTGGYVPESTMSEQVASDSQPTWNSRPMTKSRTSIPRRDA